MNDFKPKFLKPSDSSSFLDRDDNTTFAETSNFIYNRHLSQSLQTQRQRLPIFNNRNHILYLLEKYQTLVLVGETGCGKSTQVPQVSLFLNCFFFSVRLWYRVVYVILKFACNCLFLFCRVKSLKNHNCFATSIAYSW